MQWTSRRGVAETLVCAMAFLAYVPTFAFRFVYDDIPQIIQNPAIHAWRYLPSYFTAHAWAELYPNVRGNYYRPLFLLWFRLNDALFGLHPEGWHVTTVLCHVAVAYMVFVLIRRLAGSTGIAFTAATLFALHPVHIESVAWVSGVTDPLLAIFLIGAFLAYLRFRDGNHWAWLALALILFALGLLEKETVVALVPLVFVYAWLYSPDAVWNSRLRTGLTHSLGFLVVTSLYLIARAHVLHGLSHGVTPLSLRTMALTEPSVIWLYVRHLVVPAGISGLYGLPYVDHWGSAAFLVPAALLLLVVCLTGGGISRLADRRLALFACCWMVLPVVPVLWLRAYAEGDIAHDRYLYIPSIGFVLLLALVLAQFANARLAHRRVLLFAGVVALSLAYAFGTVGQEMYWADDLSLYGRAYKIAPYDKLICNDLGTALMDAGDPGSAIGLYQRVLARDPAFWLSNYNLGYTYYKLGRFEDAERFLRRATEINNTDSDQYIYLGLSLWRQGHTEEAAQCIERAIQIRPSASGYHFALALIRREQNNLPAAASEFKLELQYHPENITARQQLRALDSRQ